MGMVGEYQTLDAPLRPAVSRLANPGHSGHKQTAPFIGAFMMLWNHKSKGMRGALLRLVEYKSRLRAFHPLRERRGEPCCPTTTGLTSPDAICC